MNLREMEVFRAVMLAGTVKAAAAMLHVSQPAASKLLAAAERRANLQLFDRIKGRLTPTAAARRLFPDIEAVWKTVAKVKASTRELAGPAGGSLRIAASSGFCTYLVPKAATALVRRQPGLRLQVEMLMPHLINGDLANGIADLGLVMLPVDDPSLAVVRRYVASLVCALPATHALARQPSICAADLAGERVIRLSDTTLFADLLSPLYRELAASTNLELEVSSGAIACWFAQNGSGLAIIDSMTVAGGTFPGLVVRPFLPSPQIDVHVLRNAQKSLSPAAEMFCDEMDALWASSVALCGRPGVSVAT